VVAGELRSLGRRCREAWRATLTKVGMGLVNHSMCEKIVVHFVNVTILVLHVIVPPALSIKMALPSCLHPASHLSHSSRIQIRL
jgi:hypothetical protein